MKGKTERGDEGWRQRECKWGKQSSWEEIPIANPEEQGELPLARWGVGQSALWPQSCSGLQLEYDGGKERYQETFDVRREFFTCRSVDRQGCERQGWGQSRDDDPQHPSEGWTQDFTTAHLMRGVYVNPVLSLFASFQIWSNFHSSPPPPTLHPWLLGKNPRLQWTCRTYC